MNLLETNIERYNLNRDTPPNNKVTDYVAEGTRTSRYTERFNKYIPYKEDLNQEQKDCLQEFGKSLEYIDNALKPFKNAGINYTVGLAGGAIRDFILGKIDTIKDTDIFVCFMDKDFDFSKVPQAPLITEKMAKTILGHDFIPDTKFIESLESQDAQWWADIDINEDNEGKTRDMSAELNAWKQSEINKHHLTQICAQLMAQNNTVLDVHTNKPMEQRDSKENHYLNDQMFGNIKLTCKDLKWPVDLVVAKQPAFTFTASFDFSLCKASCAYSDINPQSSLTPEDVTLKAIECFSSDKPLWENFYDNLLIEPTLLKDIDYFMNKHYLKIKEKYPEKRLNIVTYIDDEKIRNFNNLTLNLELNHKLDDSKESNLKRKI